MSLHLFMNRKNIIFVKKKNMKTLSLQGVYLDVPENDINFLKLLAEKMGWKMDTKQSFVNSYLESRPKNVPLEDSDIMQEVASIRYKK
jgi:hypothetical protein